MKNEDKVFKLTTLLCVFLLIPYLIFVLLNRAGLVLRDTFAMVYFVLREVCKLILLFVLIKSFRLSNIILSVLFFLII